MPSREVSPDIRRPVDRNVRIWRYMDLPKYLYFVTYKSLFFSRIDKLDDPYEGSFPKVDKAKHLDWIEQFSKSEKAMPQEMVEKMKADDVKIRKNMQKDNFLNCWHMNEHESMAMWRLYGEQNKSIAIQTTYEKLHNAVSEYVTLGIVEYLDYEKDTMFEGKQYGAPIFFFKRRAFEFENELRAIMGRHKLGAIDPDQKYDDAEAGWDFKVDPSSFVERVVVSPRMPDWIYKLIMVLTLAAGFSFPVEKSSLDVSPMF